MQSQSSFTGRKAHRHEGRVHFAEVTVRAEPCTGESQVVLSREVLETLRGVFGAEFVHQRHCVLWAVAAQIATINVAGEMPHAGATTFRAEVVDVRVSGDAGREVSGYLLSVAGMNAIGDFLVAWENEQESHSGRAVGRETREADPSEGPASSSLTAPEPSGSGAALPASGIERLSEDDVRRAVYRTCYVLVWNDLNDGLTEGEIRGRLESIIRGFSANTDAAREGVEDALAGRPMRDDRGPFGDHSPLHE